VAVVLGSALLVCGEEQAGQDPVATVSPIEGSSLPKPPASTVPGMAGDSEDYVISPDDELQIDVLDVPEISRVYRVSGTGTLTLPLLPDPIHASGQTLPALGQIVSEKLQASGMVSHPHVTIQVKDSRLHSIAIMGAVKRPQIYPVLGKTTLMAALSKAEGLAENAGAIAIVTRGDIAMQVLKPGATSGVGLTQAADPGRAAAPPPQPRTVTVDLERLLEDGNASLNLDLYPGDQVTVRRAGIVYVVGAVKRAGGFVLKDDRQQMTVLKAVALAEDLKSTAVGKKAVIIRKRVQTLGATEEIPVDLEKILNGRSPDRPLLADDILFVPDSSSKKALHRAGEAAAQAVALFVYRLP
jgi:polysaccharide export outer membrane protein